jgi:hypothetical protein
MRLDAFVFHVVEHLKRARAIRGIGLPGSNGLRRCLQDRYAQHHSNTQ